MPRILIDPDRLRLLSAQLQQIVGDLQGVEGRFGGALGQLNWEARQKANVDGQTRHARGQARALMGQAEEMARYLERKALAFEETDGQGSNGLGQVRDTFRRWLASVPSWWSFPSHQVNALGNILGQPSPVQILRMTFTGGAAVVGLAALTTWSTEVSEAMRGFAERIRNWLQGRGWRADQEIRDQEQTYSEQGEDNVGQEIRETEQENSEQGEYDTETEVGIGTAGDHQVARPRITDPSMNSPWRQVNVPIKNSPGQRSPNSYRNVIEQFDVQDSYPGRYRPSDQYPDTRCNIFAGDVMRAMGVPLPTKGDLGVGHGNAQHTDPMTANATDLNSWLNTEQDGWRRIDSSNPDDLRVLQEHLEAGKPALASDPGHVAVLRPDHLPDNLSRDNLGSLHIAQAGAYNYNDIALQETGFGNVFNPAFFIHD